MVWSVVLIQTAAFSIANQSEVKWLDESEKAFADWYAHNVKGVTDTTAVFEVTAYATKSFDNRQYSVEAKQEWLYGRFVIYQAKALTAADGLNGVEFDGVVRVEADALRLTAAEGSEPEALKVAMLRHKTLNGPWRLPNGADFERYSLRRVKGEWKIAEYNSGWDSGFKALRVHWLCGKPRPQAVPVDEAKVKEECLAAYAKVRRATVGGFVLRYLGYDDPVRQAPAGSKVKVHDLLVEYRSFGEAKLEVQRVDDAERANGIEARFVLREWDGARFVREASVRELKDGEVKPRLRCSSPGVEVSSEWSDLKLLSLTAERIEGAWRFSTLDGEAVGE